MNQIVGNFCKTLVVAMACSPSAWAQTPGDGIPDFYYFPSDGLVVETSLGPITRDAGILTVDSDGADLIAMFVSASPAALNDCLLCDGMNLPGESVPLSSAWTLGASQGTLQWIRTNPLSGPGFEGVIGTGYLDDNGQPQPWPEDFPPFLDFPAAESGIVNLGPGLTENDFPSRLGDGPVPMFSVQWVPDVGGGGFTNVTIVPEPAPLAGISVGLLGLLLSRRRRR